MVHYMFSFWMRIFHGSFRVNYIIIPILEFIKEVFMFYDNLNALCKSKGTTVTALLKELNISTSKGTAWKSGSVPKGDILSKIAAHFNVSTDYLLGNTDNQQGAKTDFAPETLEFIRLFENLPDDKKMALLNFLEAFTN